MASARLVLPSWLCPSSATLRILSGSTLAIASPFRRECKAKQRPSPLETARNNLPPPLGTARNNLPPPQGRAGWGLLDRREWDDLDRLSDAHLSCPLRDDDQAIGIGHRAKHVRALVAGQPDTDPVALTAGEAAEVLLEVRRVLQGVVCGGRQSLPLEIGATLHLQDRGADEQLDADEGRDGVAGQSDEWPAFDRSQHERLSRPKRDLPEVDGPLLFQERADQVVGAHRDATRADDQVGSDRCLEPGDEVLPDVARHPDIDDLRTRLLEGR